MSPNSVSWGERNTCRNGAACLLAGELSGEKKVGRKQMKEFLLGDLRLVIARGNQGMLG